MDALGLEPAISRVFGPHFTTDKQPRFGLKHGGLWVAYPKGCFLTALNSAFLAFRARHANSDLSRSARAQHEATADSCAHGIVVGNPNVGTFVSHEKEHARKSLNALSVLNGSVDNLCAGR